MYIVGMDFDSHHCDDISCERQGRRERYRTCHIESTDNYLRGIECGLAEDEDLQNLSGKVHMSKFAHLELETKGKKP